MNNNKSEDLSFRNAQEFTEKAEKKIPIIVTDEFHQPHVLKKDLSSGGQGTVFLTEDSELLVKLCFVSSKQQEFVTDSQQKEDLQNKFLQIGLLPIDDSLPLALPIATIKEKAGYVMRFASGMQEFQEHFTQSRQQQKQELEKQLEQNELPIWLQAFFEKEHAKNQGKGTYQSLQYLHYLKSGSLRRRLEALSQCAGILARLHAKGLVYVDLSLGNVFISKSLNFNHVWMIDADNLRFDGQKGDNFYTPEYGAPEVVQGYPASQLSDSHAFAVLCFYLLSMIFPYNGKAFYSDDEGDWADEDDWDNNESLTAEQKKERGLLAFIDDIHDDSNAMANGGIPRKLILTDELKQLFQNTLGDGKQAPWKRANIQHWPAALAKAADQTLCCSDCGMTYLVNEQHKCPYCSNLSPINIQLTSYLGSDTQHQVWSYAHELTKQKLLIPQRVFRPFSIKHYSKAEMQVTLNEKSISVKMLNEDLSISWAAKSYQNGHFQRFVGELILDFEMIAAGTFFYIDDEQSSRLIRLQLSEATR